MTAREKIHALNSCHKYFSCPVPRVMSSSAEGEARPKGRKEVVWKCARELRLRRLLCLWSIKVAVHTLHHSRLFSSILHKITNFSYLHGIGGHLGCELFWIKLWGRGGEWVTPKKQGCYVSVSSEKLFIFFPYDHGRETEGVPWLSWDFVVNVGV